MEGKTVGELISEAIRAYLMRQGSGSRSGSLRALEPEPYPEGNEHLSQEVDRIVYGGKQ